MRWGLEEYLTLNSSDSQGQMSLGGDGIFQEVENTPLLVLMWITTKEYTTASHK
jgi:hypothetical protein